MHLDNNVFSISWYYARKELHYVIGSFVHVVNNYYTVYLLWNKIVNKFIVQTENRESLSVLQ